MNNHKGFTLIELMVVVTMVAILAAIALPSYQSFVQRSATRQAQAIADGFSVQLGDWLVRNSKYDNFTPEDYAPISDNYYLPAGATASDYKYQVRIVSDDGSSANLLSATDMIHRNWHIYAIPNPSGNLKYADKFYINSADTRCRIDNTSGTATMPTNTTIAAEDCTSSLTKEW